MSERLNGTRSRSCTPPRAPVVRTPRRGRRTEEPHFHPKLITTQIVCIQCLHYVLLGFLFQINYLLFNKSVTIDRIFTDQYVRIWKASGWIDVWTLLLGSLFGYVRPYCNRIPRYSFSLLSFLDLCCWH